MTYLERLVVLHRFWEERAHDVHGTEGVEVCGECGADCRGAQLVRDSGRARVRTARRRERAGKLDLERKDVLTSLDRVLVIALALEKGPVMGINSTVVGTFTGKVN